MISLGLKSPPPRATAIVLVARANRAANAYRVWRREWQAMNGELDLETLRIKGVMAILLGVVLVFGVAGVIGAYPATTGRALGWIIGLSPIWLAVLAVWMLVSWSRRRRRANERVPVEIVAKIILPAPSLAAAYAALPEHCQRLLARSGS